MEKNASYCLFKTEKKRVVWEVTHRCNYSCVHCCSRAGEIEEAELDTQKTYEVLRELAENDTEEIYFSGGEPFIRDDMFDILKYARELGILANVSTNGSFLTEELAMRLKDIDVNLIHISLDSHVKEDFNSFRGGDYYTKTLDAIRHAKEAGLYVRVGAVIWKKNASHIKEMIDFFSKMGVDEVVFNWLIAAGRYQDNKEMGVPLSKFEDTIKLIHDYMSQYKDIIKVSMHRSEKYYDDGSMCNAGKKILFILPDGRISPCSWLAKLDHHLITKDSLMNSSLNDLLESSTFKNWEKFVNDRAKKCKAGCPAICLERTGDYCSEDPLVIKQ